MCRGKPPRKKAPQHPTPKPREERSWNGGRRASQGFEAEHYRRLDTERSGVPVEDKAEAELAGAADRKEEPKATSGVTPAGGVTE